ncbi:MAG: nucleotide exchange factor GrpE [Planctomycetaceae bacterium]
MSREKKHTEAGDGAAADTDSQGADVTAEAVASAAAAIDSDELQKLRQEADEARDRSLRAQAELDNFRRRTQREVDEFRKYQSIPIIRDMLPGLDNLKRAVGAAEQSGDLQNLLDGIHMVSQQFEDVLKAHSAIPIRPQGQPFDPNLHEALTQVPSAEHPPMTVLDVVETGYKLHDRVIRPAKVIVACAPPPTNDAASTDAD